MQNHPESEDYKVKIYSIEDIIPTLKETTEYFIGIFEDSEDPEIEWPHRHSFYSMVWFTQGNGFNVIDFDEFEIKPNRIFTIRPKQIHNWNYSLDTKGYFIVFAEHLAKELNIDFHSPFVDIGDSDKGFIEEILKRLVVDCHSSANTFQRNKLGISYLYSLLNEPQRVLTSASTSIINDFKRLISETYETSLTIEQYAIKLNVSTDELNQICQEGTGLSPKQLQLDIKITEARRLLLYSELNNSEIAYKLGFEDTSYFSRIFKKKTNLSPTVFRQKYPNNRKKS